MKTEDIRIHSGMNLREALRAANRMGCDVRPVRRTGELRVLHRGTGSVRLNGRRTDAPRALTQLLMAVRKAAAAPAPVAGDRGGCARRETAVRPPRRERGVSKRRRDICA